MAKIGICDDQIRNKASENCISPCRLKKERYEAAASIRTYLDKLYTSSKIKG